MIRIKDLTVKNFMSVGNATQSINFDRGDLTLVLGENLDLGADGSRNGTGKTTILNALSYALYGQALTNIKRDNLINKTNGKNMLITVNFSIGNDEYQIHRGRKPAIFKFYKNSVELGNEDDEAQGDSRDTQREIEALLQMSHDMFKHILALNTYSEPFLSMRTNDQRNIIEQLLGITILSEKAVALKELNKETKNAIKEEEFRLQATIKANQHIEEQILSLERRQKMWIAKNKETVDHITLQLENLIDLDIDAELLAHQSLENYNKSKSAIDECNKWISQIDRENENINKRVLSLENDLKHIEEHKCHACGQEIHDSKQEEIRAAKQEELSKQALQYLSNETQKEEHIARLAEIGVLGKKPKTIYSTITEVYDHKHTLDKLTHQLEVALADTDPYEEQIEDMRKKGLQEIDYTELNRLSEIQEHQNFLLNLLTSKDSFIRKKIIEQNLSYLNGRLGYYLEEIGLPHQVKFLSDLSVEITDLGRDLDFDNLSRGERNRLILSLSWAFRDVWESLYNHINLLFIDELVDSGLDTSGVESAIKILKRMTRDRGKSVWLVSHRDELISRVHNTMRVVKESGFTTYENN
jgi:DNA repair exonuclease SbcCD ATPase subunit